MEAFYEGLVAETQPFVILAPLCSENLTLEGRRVPSWSHLGSKIAPNVLLKAMLDQLGAHDGGLEALRGSWVASGALLGLIFGIFSA